MDKEKDIKCECNEECNCKEKKHNKKDKYLDEINELKEKNRYLEEKMLLTQADLINYRKRKDEEIVKLLTYANEDIIKELLITLDNFERAINLDDENLDDNLSKFLSGFKMIYCNTKSVLEKYGVKAIDGNNKLFDPTYHQAVITAKVDNVESGMIIEVLQKGYIYKDKVIRPAMVRVSE